MTEQKTSYAKKCNKPLREQISIVAEFHAHKIAPQRIAYRTGVELELVMQLVREENHQRLFKHLLAQHRRARRDLRLKKSLRLKGIAQADLQDKIEEDYLSAESKPH
ncbi:MAG: hypothetical protein ACJAYG_002407 [Oceanicoccus sp.]|jgi:hypothetical protein